MKRVFCFITVLFVAVMFIGCGTTSSLKWGADSTTGLRGKTEQEIISELGKPYKKYTNSEGIKILEYRQSAKDAGSMNSLVAVASFGLLSGKDSAYADIMKIYFSDGVVTKATFEENVQVLTMPGI
jgi:hypothetical protein